MCVLIKFLCQDSIYSIDAIFPVLRQRRGRRKVHDYFLLLLCKSSIWFRETLFQIKCGASYVIQFEVYDPQLSTAVAWREKKSKRFVFNKYFCLVLGVLKSKISKKFGEGFLRKLDFRLFHYKAMVKPVSKITTIATRNMC